MSGGSALASAQRVHLRGPRTTFSDTTMRRNLARELGDGSEGSGVNGSQVTAKIMTATETLFARRATAVNENRGQPFMIKP